MNGVNIKILIPLIKNLNIPNPDIPLKSMNHIARHFSLCQLTLIVHKLSGNAITDAYIN
jgi:hypothetical protein